ncbi:hypothetical protein IWW57_000276 [Coemansia sp. S610]|nr:hypothetical protein IWW57_000276 [Coemansia sp. S610]
MSIAVVGIACAAVFFIALFGVFYLRKVKGADTYVPPSTNATFFSFLRRKGGKKKNQQLEEPEPKLQQRRRPPPQQQQQRQPQQQSRPRPHHSVNYSEQPTRSVRRYDEEEDVEAPIPGLFDVPDFDSPEGTSQPRAPAAVARSPNAGGGANPVIDRRFPNEPMPAGMPSILAQIQDPSNESSLPAPPPSEPPADSNYPYYGPMVYSEAGMDAYRAANGLPPPPAGSTATYSVLPSAAERSQGGGAQQQEQAARQRAMAEHYYRLQAQQAQQMQAMQAMHSMPPIPMAHLAPMAHMPPMMAYPPMHQAMPPAMPQPQAMPQAPEPVAASNPRFGSPEEEEAWKQSNRMTTSSPPAYSAY